MIGNHRVPNIANDEMLHPLAKIDDGYLDFQVMYGAGKIATLNLFRQMMNRGSHLTNHLLRYVKTHQVKIEPLEHLVFNIDGETYYSSSIKVEVIPKCINYIGIQNS